MNVVGFPDHLDLTTFFLIFFAAKRRLYTVSLFCLYFRGKNFGNHIEESLKLGTSLFFSCHHGKNVNFTMCCV